MNGKTGKAEKPFLYLILGCPWLVFSLSLSSSSLSWSSSSVSCPTSQLVRHQRDRRTPSTSSSTLAQRQHTCTHQQLYVLSHSCSLSLLSDSACYVIRREEGEYAREQAGGRGEKGKATPLFHTDTQKHLKHTYTLTCTLSQIFPLLLCSFFAVLRITSSLKSHTHAPSF